MIDYQPLDLSSLANGTLDLLPDSPTGQQSFHGLPFLIGPPERPFLALGRGLHDGAVRIPIGTTARNLLFAQRLLESSVLTGGPLGVEVADYFIRYADGSTEQHTIRERF